MRKDAKIYVAGHRGLVGSAIVRELRSQGYDNLITRTSAELDLRYQAVVDAFFRASRPEYVFLAAAKVGGILANNRHPAEFIYDNLAIATNVIHAAYCYGVKKLLFLGSSCIYPKYARQPLKEEYLLTGELEPTNEWYAVAKIAGVKLCQAYRRQYGANFIAVMPANLYGINDNFDLETSHVLPALLRKFHEAKAAGMSAVTVWGSGNPRREFLYVDDLAEACCFLMQNYNDEEIINVGTGTDITIRELAELIREIVGFNGDIVYDRTKPDGTFQKLLDVTKINRLGWQAKTGLREGIEKTYRWFKDCLN
ncbi:GDP-L-fucose synthase [Sporolituus thermophilus]|uniref:GDP-L-fucose synthase n=1 Tax=Sporolituus thermophilus DSM 23256 TaxID=1123285 RepID=A0A1G7LVX0_9FIRM|nr:GDP-L-fucose synthase [Sporolituus thermophilus]SDF53645.1 GDP-L-fucose synthase [Sporolituus thermophilus DSM 23256]